MKRLAPIILAFPLLLASCSGTTEEVATPPAPSSTTSTTPTTQASSAVATTTQSSATTTAEPDTPTEVVPETVQQQIKEAATEGRGPRPPLDEMTLLDGFGYVGIYMANDDTTHYLCDARGYPSMDIMGEDGCSQPMEWGEIQQAFSDSLERSFENG